MGSESDVARVYLVRHGQTALNAQGQLRGRLDPPLDECGLRQAAALGAAFGQLECPPGRITAGPLVRTQQTAAPTARALGLDVSIDERFIDRDYGPWAGAASAEVEAQFGRSLAGLPDAESLEEVVRRALAGLHDQVQHAARPALVVAHDVVNRLLLANLDPSLGAYEDIAQGTACWNLLEQRGGRWLVRRVNGSAADLLAGHHS